MDEEDKLLFETYDKQGELFEPSVQEVLKVTARNRERFPEEYEAWKKRSERNDRIMLFATITTWIGVIVRLIIEHPKDFDHFSISMIAYCLILAPLTYFFLLVLPFIATIGSAGYIVYALFAGPKELIGEIAIAVLVLGCALYISFSFYPDVRDPTRPLVRRE